MSAAAAPSLALRIGTRGSPLALAQTHLIARALEAATPGLVCEAVVIRTTGDRWSESSARTVPPGKGIFTGELESALREGRIDLAVHSLKDLPTEDADALVIGAIPPRADARDTLITRDEIGLAELPPGAIIATGSGRRLHQLLAARPDVQGVDIRGNIDTRLRKLRENEAWSGLILAQAGLLRLRPELDGLTCQPLPLEIMLPAPGQGALALQIRAGDESTAAIIRPIDDPATRAAVTAERAFLSALGGGCSAPVGAWSEMLPGGQLRLRGIVWWQAESAPRRGGCEGPAEAPKELGERLAREVLVR